MAKKDNTQDAAFNDAANQLNALIAQQGTAHGVGHGEGLWAHLIALRDAVVARDFLAIYNAVTDLLIHFREDAGMKAGGDEMKALPWALILQLIIQIAQQLLVKTPQS